MEDEHESDTERLPVTVDANFDYYQDEGKKELNESHENTDNLNTTSDQKYTHSENDESQKTEIDELCEGAADRVLSQSDSLIDPLSKFQLDS